MVQPSASNCLLAGLLGLVLLVPALMAPTPPGLCTAIKTLNGSLSHKRLYMKDYFPINYTIKVHAEEVFKLSNISRLRMKEEGLEELVLQRLWFLVNQGVLKKILRVLPERHPSYLYTAKLEKCFKDAEGVLVMAYSPEELEKDLPERIQDIWDRLTEEPDKVPESSWRLAYPNSLMSNFRRTMHCLFRDCFLSTDQQHESCVSSYWRKGRNQDVQPER